MTPSPDEKTEAKACPFCDKEPTIIKAFDKPVAVCQSEGCALAGFWVVLEQWNRRTPAQAADVDKVLAEQQGEIERLREEAAWRCELRAYPDEQHDTTRLYCGTCWDAMSKHSQSLTASLERVKELEKENEQLRRWYEGREKAKKMWFRKAAEHGRRVVELKAALSAIAEALKEPDGGSFWQARKFLDLHDVYHGDLNDLRVLNAVVQTALKGGNNDGK